MPDSSASPRVLIVEDDADTRTLVTRLLSLGGYDVQAAGDASEALTVTKWFVPHVALIDLGLPDRHGSEVARDLRQRFGPSVCIVAVTGFEAGDQPAPDERLFDERAIKPVNYSELVEGLLAKGGRTSPTE